MSCQQHLKLTILLPVPSSSPALDFYAQGTLCTFFFYGSLQSTPVLWPCRRVVFLMIWECVCLCALPKHPHRKHIKPLQTNYTQGSSAFSASTHANTSFRFNTNRKRSSAYTCGAVFFVHVGVKMFHARYIAVTICILLLVLSVWRSWPNVLWGAEIVCDRRIAISRFVCVCGWCEWVVWCTKGHTGYTVRDVADDDDDDGEHVCSMYYTVYTKYYSWRIFTP